MEFSFRIYYCIPLFIISVFSIQGRLLSLVDFMDLRNERSVAGDQGSAVSCLYSMFEQTFELNENKSSAANVTVSSSL